MFSSELHLFGIFIVRFRSIAVSIVVETSHIIILPEFFANWVTVNGKDRLHLNFNANDFCS